MYVLEVTKRLKENGENIVAFLSNGNGVYSKTAIVDLGKSFHQEAVKSLLICFLAASFSFHQELEKMRKKSSYWKIKLFFGFAYLASQGEYRVTYFVAL